MSKVPSDAVYFSKKISASEAIAAIHGMILAYGDFQLEWLSPSFPFCGITELRFEVDSFGSPIGSPKQLCAKELLEKRS